MDCDKKANYCNNQNVKMVQMKSDTSPNRYNGEILMMCEQCRKDYNGQIKLVK